MEKVVQSFFRAEFLEIILPKLKCFYAKLLSASMSDISSYMEENTESIGDYLETLDTAELTFDKERAKLIISCSEYLGLSKTVDKICLQVALSNIPELLLGQTKGIFDQRILSAVTRGAHCLIRNWLLCCLPGMLFLLKS